MNRGEIVGLTLKSRLGSARLRVHVDIGVGDAVISEPGWIEYPSRNARVSEPQ